MQSQSHEDFKPPCPYCRGEGVATKLVLSQEQRTITYTCRTCERAWICGDPPTESGRTQPATLTPFVTAADAD
jgi:hypothetical protein